MIQVAELVISTHTALFDISVSIYTIIYRYVKAYIEIVFRIKVPVVVFDTVVTEISITNSYTSDSELKFRTKN